MRIVDDHLVSLLRPGSWEAEPYRTLRHAIERRRGSARSLVLAISSAAPGDGKTTTSLNLAAALAEQKGTRVVIIDADLRRCALARELGLEDQDAGPGLASAVLDPRLTLGEVVRQSPRWRFSVIPAGEPPARPCDVLESPRFGELLQELRRQYGYIIIDTPPFVPFIDCRALSRSVDCFALVVAAHRTPRKLLEESLNLIDPDKLLGLVYNNDDGPLWGSNRYYQYMMLEQRPADDDRALLAPVARLLP